MCDPVSATIAAVSAATTAYGADRQRKAVNAQGDALRASQEADARQAAEAETSAAVAANAKVADAKARRRASALGQGATDGSDTLGGAPSVLATGAPAGSSAARASAPGAAAAGAGSALGAGAPAVTRGTVSPTMGTPRAVSRSMAA